MNTQQLQDRIRLLESVIDDQMAFGSDLYRQNPTIDMKWEAAYARGRKALASEKLVDSRHDQVNTHPVVGSQPDAGSVV